MHSLTLAVHTSHRSAGLDIAHQRSRKEKEKEDEEEEEEEEEEEGEKS